MKNKVINLFKNKQVVQNTGVKYSELLEQFMNPFTNEFRKLEYVEDIFEFAMNAWNCGNIEALIPDGELKKSMDVVEEENYALLRKMIDYKISDFKQYENFIIDYEFEELETGEDPILRIVTQEKGAYLANIMDSIENEAVEDDFEENYINRGAIILKPQQPFWDWYSKLNPNEDPDDFLEDMKETNIYLVDDEIYDVEEWLKKKFDKFFMMELDDWCENKKKWPQRRSYKMFESWFRVETTSLVYDMERKPVFKSE